MPENELSDLSSGLPSVVFAKPWFQNSMLWCVWVKTAACLQGVELLKNWDPGYRENPTYLCPQKT